MELKRLTLLISGNVQRAGYRDKIVELGRGLGLTGYAENLMDGRVKVVAEGDNKELELLKDGANIKNALINVEQIKGSFSNATGEFSGFFKLVGDGETDERLDVAAGLLKELIEVTRSGFSDTIGAVKSVKEDTSAMLEKQDSMLEKQDVTINVLKSVKEDTSAIREDISMTRKDKDELYQKYEYLSREITEMKSTLSEIKAKLL